VTYKVFQWASGTVGRHAASAVLERADCQLVGLHTLTAAKVGRDIGELLGVAPLGIRATGRLDAVLDSDADVVIHAPLASLVFGDRDSRDIEDICALLGAGKNVITVVGYLHPKVHGAALVARLDDACRRGRATFHSTGLNPGWMGDLLPLTMSALSRDIERIVVREITNFEFYPSPEIMFDVMGFGAPVERFERDGERRRRWLNAREIATAPDRLQTAAGTLEPGTVAGQRWTWTGRANDRDRIVHETVWRMHRSVAPQWPTGKHTVTVEGTPRISIALAGDWISDGLLATAMHAVNAIPAVCAAAPGISTRLDLPGVYGRATR
jgi:hypothetical protein